MRWCSRASAASSTWHYAFDDLAAMTAAWHPCFDALRPSISGSGFPYVTIDLVEHINRRWIENLLAECDFQAMGEWLELVHPGLRDVVPPEIPEGLTMRRAQPDDSAAIAAIEGAAYGDWTDGEAATLARIEEAAWTGVLERDGDVIAYAINTAVEDGRGEVMSCAVAPDAQGDGLGKVILGAATYQLAASDGREAAVRVRPDIPTAAPYRHGARLPRGAGAASSCGATPTRPCCRRCVTTRACAA